jgi:hypothetical protein
MHRVKLLRLPLVAILALLLVGQAPTDPRLITNPGIFGEAAVVSGPSYQGHDVQVHLPADLHVRNFGAPRDGKGLCVFASMTMAARYLHVTGLYDVIHKVPYGGGWPEKVDQVLQQFAPPGLQCRHYEGTDLTFFKTVLATGRPACVTYGYGERYRGTIYHMVLLTYLDDNVACILDNNFPGEENYEWMSATEFRRRFCHPSGRGWGFAFVGKLAPPPPPVPCN